MERTKGDEGKIKYKKVGGGSHRMGNRIIKPGQIFMAHPDEIAKTFKDVLVPVDSLPDEEVQKVESVETKYILKRRGTGGGWYDVVDKQDKVLNEKALKRDAALQLIKDLEK